MRRDSQSAVDIAHSKLSVVKSNTIVSSMNAYSDGMIASKRASASLTSPSANDKIADVGSCAIVTVRDNNIIQDHVSQPPIRAKMATAIPRSIQLAPNLFSELLSTVLGRSMIWKNAEVLKAKLYEHVYSGVGMSSMDAWEKSADGTSVSMRTSSGVLLRCALLRSAQAVGPVGNTGKNDHQFAQRVLSQGVTNSYSQQPMEFSASLDNCCHVFKAAVYPCSMKQTGLFMGTLHMSGFDIPLKSCAVVANNTLQIHPKWGINEADATVLMIPYTRSHVGAISSMFVKCAVMRAILGTKAPTNQFTDLCNMDETGTVNQYTLLRSMLSADQLQSSSIIWKDMNRTGVGSPKLNYGVTCVAGTIDSFQKDSSHTILSLHTRSIIDAKFVHNNEEFIVKSPLIVSMYGGYFHPW
jgi:hypothetical protein